MGFENFTQYAEEPSLSGAFDKFETYLFQKLNVLRLGVIQEVLENNQVKCSFVNKRLVRQNKDGSQEWAEYPPIYAQVWYMGSGATGINYPLQVGQPVLMFFADREIDSYLETGEISILQDLRMHDYNDCIVIPLYRPQPVENTLTIAANNIELTGTLTINGQPYLSHTHTNGNQGSPTGGVITGS